ncbi:MAG TPA: efflux transporter outer membrane subunit [Burkholderiales bacterium]|jgi:NodT family efflux transporter outer membrane factor (OMF) lipoprotein|nr:efflux transporter outer membrane subunit [Burkholderiales bacterium]
MKRFLASVCVLVAFSGCSLVPTYHRPTAPLPASWSTPVPSATSETPLAGQWWRTFNSPELDTFIARGVGGNFNLQAAFSRVEQARGAAQVAGAAQYPNVAVGVAAASRGIRTATGQATYEIDFWGKNRAIAQSAIQLADATQFDAQTLRITLGASIADSYFQVLSFKERLDLARVIVSDAQRVLTLVETRARLGTASNLEIAEQRNALKTFEAAIPALQQAHDQALYQLAVLVGDAPQGFQIRDSGLDAIAAPEVRADTPIAVLSRRPDVAAAEARLKSANFDVGAARAAFLPSVSLSALVDAVLQPTSAVFSLVGAATLPVFTGGQLTGQLRVDRAHADELVATYRQTIIEALRDVESQLTAVRQLDQVNGIDRDAVESAREAARLARVRFDLGVIDFLTLLTTQRTLYQAEDTLLQVKLQRLQAAIGLYRALGEDVHD